MSDLHCPNCGTELDLATAFCAETDRKALERLVATSVPLGARVLQYIGLHQPAKQRLTAAKKIKLLLQLLPDLERRAIEVQGVQWQAPLELWSLAFERVFAVADSGAMSLPLNGHGYLYSTIRDQANKAAAKAEAKAEQDKRNTPQRGSVQVNGGATSIGEALGHKDPALADLDQRTSQAAKPNDEIRQRIAQITGKAK